MLVRMDIATFFLCTLSFFCVGADWASKNWMIHDIDGEFSVLHKQENENDVFSLAVDGPNAFSHPIYLL